jgi:hypothetical protein
MIEGSFTNYNHTQRMADAQEAHARKVRAEVNPRAVLFTLYTTRGDGLHYTRVARYFAGATLYLSQGLWNGELEHLLVIKVVGTMDDLQKVTDLAGDIRVANNDTAVLVTYERVGSILVTE